MYKEFILRDGEIAFNMPDGTVTIMNVNTYLQLQKALKEQEEEGPSFFEVAVGLLLAAGAAADPEDPSDPEPENKKVLTDEAFKKWARLPENKEKVKNQPVVEEENKTFKVKGVVPAFALPGKPYSRGTYTIVASDGRIFRSGTEVEYYYDLPVGSVSSFFCGRQKFLYQGPNSKGAGLHYPGKKIGLARTPSDRFATDTSTEYRFEWLAKKMENNYSLYRTLVREAEQTKE